MTRSPLSPGPFSPRPQKTRRKRRERAIGATFHTLILIGCLLSLLPLQSMQAQGTNTIAYQQTVAGRITNDMFRVVYTFQGRKGDIIDATLSQTDGTLDPVLLLADDQNNLLAVADDSASDFNASLLSVSLPNDSTYFLIVTRFGQERGLTVGGYSLTLALAGVAGGPDVFLQYGNSLVGEIDNTQFQHIYAFRANRGDVIDITMQRISGNLDALLILADANGKVLLSNDEDADSPGTLDAGIRNLRIEETGNYELVATRFGKAAGQSHGGFSLSLNRLPPETLGKVPEKAILLDYGTTTKGVIDSNNVLHFYLIEAKRGDILTIDVERTDGNLDPILALYTEDLKELATNDSGIRGQNARISGYAVPADGNYILMVSRFNRDTGITAGSFSLSLTGRTGVTVGAGGKLTLQYSSAANAIISDGNAAQEYTFAASAGDIVSVKMDTTSGNLLPELILLDPSGKQIALDDPGTDSAKLTRIKIPSAGNYVIVATRRGRDKGTTQGAYVLTLDNGQ